MEELPQQSAEGQTQLRKTVAALIARVYSLHHRKERNQRVFEGVPVLASQVFAFIEQELGIKACEDVRNRVYLNLYV